MEKSAQAQVQDMDDILDLIRVELQSLQISVEGLAPTAAEKQDDYLSAMAAIATIKTLIGTKGVKDGETKEGHDSSSTSRKSEDQPYFPARRALANSLINHAVMHKLATRSLKSNRLVCRLFEEEATKELLKPKHNRNLEVKFRWCKSIGDYKLNLTTTLEQFHRTYANSHKFPCTQFSFIGGYLTSPSFVNFCTDFGPKVIFLELQPIAETKRESSAALKTFGLILFKMLPNLERLTLNSIEWTRGLQLPKVVSDDGQLPLLHHYLKCVTLPEQRVWPSSIRTEDPTVIAILKAAANLNSVTDRNLLFTREIVNAGKFHLLKKFCLDLDFSNSEVSSRVQEFAQQGPQLETLVCRQRSTLSLMTRREIPALSRILNSSQPTLRNIEGMENLNHNILQLPRLKMVANLHLKLNDGCSPGGVVPRGRSLMGIFPKLETLTIDDPSILENPQNSSLTLITLHLNCPSENNVILAQLRYPNVKNIHLTATTKEHHNDLPNTLRAIFSAFPPLEKLHIIIKVSSSSWELTGEMDAAFSGLPLDLCRDIKSQVQEKPDPKILEHLKTNPLLSLQKLESLKELKICVEYDPSLVLDRPRVHTRVSELYAFDLLKQRQGLNWGTFETPIIPE